MTKYYKSRNLAVPVVYVQREDFWESHPPTGQALRTDGLVPETILLQVDEIEPAEADELIKARTQVATQAPDAQAIVGPRGLRGWLIVPIIGLFLTLLSAAVTIYSDVWLVFQTGIWSELTTAGTPSYHPAWAPLFLFEVFVVLVLVVAPIVLLVLLFQKRRILPKLIISFYGFCFLALAVESVAILALGSHLIPDLGIRQEVGWTTQDILFDIVRGLVLTAIWIPYFVFSRRVDALLDQVVCVHETLFKTRWTQIGTLETYVCPTASVTVVWTHGGHQRQQEQV